MYGGFFKSSSSSQPREPLKIWLSRGTMTTLPPLQLPPQDASFLFAASASVVQEFAKMAVEVILKGEGAAKGYGKAAKVLGVKVEAVDQGVSSLCSIFTTAARSDLSDQQMLELLADLGFEQVAGEALARYFVLRKGQIRDVVATSKLDLPSYKRLDWRLDVQVASRHLRNQASPSFFLRLLTKQGSSLPSSEVPAEIHNDSDCKGTFLESDYATLKAVCAELELALQEPSTRHVRRVVRYFK